MSGDEGPGYRLEYAPNNRAKCSGPKPCSGTKLPKGELRMGTMVNHHGQKIYKWRHWGCTTARMLSNFKNQFDRPDELDGFDALTDEDKDRIRTAWAEGHVADEDIPASARKDKDGGDDRGSKKKASEGKKGVDKVEEAEEEKPVRVPTEAKADDETTEGEDMPKEKRAPVKKQAVAEEEIEDAIPSDNWWIVTHWNKKQPLNRSVTRKLDRAALGGKRCLITLERGPLKSIDRCHLVPRSSEPDTISKLRYAWGRVLIPNDPWNLFYLRSDIHKAFDAGAWALVPEKSLVENIRKAIQAERTHRQKNSITGPWPDLGVANWSKTDGYDYTFVPLTLQDEDIIITRRDKPMENDPDRFTLSIYHAPYSDFPHLRCHVHPYAVIKDAYPKLDDHIDILPEEIIEMMTNLRIIFKAWEKVEEEAASRLHPPSTISSRTTQTGAAPGGPGVGPSASQSEEGPGTNNDSTGLQGEPTLSGSNSGGQGEHENTTSHPAPPSSFTKVQAKLAEADQTVRLPKSFYEWILGVEVARQRNQLVEAIDHSLDLEKYAMEEARAPPTDDWHSWRSEYALWYTPPPKNRGVFSSNDWVEVKNYPPLTRVLRQDE